MSRGPQNPERMERVRALHEQGLSWGQIAAQLGLTKCQVAGLINRHIKGYRWRAAKPQRPRNVPAPPPTPAGASGAQPDCASSVPTTQLRAPPPDARFFAGDGRCKWITTNGRPWRYCDAPVCKPGSAWCEVHRSIVYHTRHAA